jgi:uncharacterized protein (TIGR03382 family)
VRASRLVCAAALWILLASSGRAAIIFQYVTDAQHYVVTNGNVTVKLFLQETDTQGSPSLLASEAGLFGAGVVVNQLPGGAHPATMLGVAANMLPDPPNPATTPFPGFNGLDNAVLDNNNRRARILEGVSLSALVGGPSGTTTGGKVTNTGGTRITDVFLGTLTIRPGDPLTTTSFNVMPYSTFSGSDGNTVSFTSFPPFDLDVSHPSAPVFTGADSFIISPFVFDVTAVPEPSTVSLGVLLLISGAVLRARRRGRATAARPTPPVA